MRRDLRRSGFTLIEIMLVVIIIGVLAGMVVPQFVNRAGDAKKARAKSDIAQIGLALDLYELDIGSYPENIDGLITKPSGVDETWKGPYVKRGEKGLVDPWGRKYIYTFDHSKPGEYELKSQGPNESDTNDDLTNAE